MGVGVCYRLIAFVTRVGGGGGGAGSINLIPAHMHRTHLGELEQLGGLRRAQLHRARGRRHELHPHDHLLHGGERGARPVGRHLFRMGVGAFR